MPFKFSTNLVPYLPYPSTRPYGAREDLGTRLIFDRTDQKFDLNFSVQIFKRLGDNMHVKYKNPRAGEPVDRYQGRGYVTVKSAVHS